MVLCQGEQDACGAAALPLPAEAAVADAPARWALPLRIKQSLLDVFSVSVPQTRPTELALDPTALLTTTARLGVDRLLATLVTGGALGTHD